MHGFYMADFPGAPFEFGFSLGLDAVIRGAFDAHSGNGTSAS